MQQFRWFGVRQRLSATLILAAAVPLATGLISIHFLGRQYYQRDKAYLFDTLSNYLAQALGSALNARVTQLRDFVQLSDLGDLVEAGSPPVPPPGSSEFEAWLNATEVRWQGLDESADEVRAVLDHPVAKEARRFRALHPQFAEILITDSAGRLVGATNKTSDYWQADEAWWVRGAALPAGRVWIEGVDFDRSARVYSLDLVVPVYASSDLSRPVAVVKGVLDISPIFSSIRPILLSPRPVREVVLEDGRVLTRLFDPSVEPLRDRIDPGIARELATLHDNLSILSSDSGEKILVGLTRIRLEDASSGIVSGLTPMYVIVHDSLEAIMQPIHAQLRSLTLAGIGLIACFLVLGLLIADRKIFTPVHRLRLAAQAMADHSRAQDRGAPAAPSTDPDRTRRLIDQLEQIRSHDEFGDLAHDFRDMAARILSYHEHLESELATKTEEIQQDLVVAREFQEAMLPSTYPRVPRRPGSDPVRLTFSHVYRPATSVGGDFFQVLRVSDHEAGVFIADVMGHGARSALITAILRTILESVTLGTREPGEVLGRMNEQFATVVPQGEDVIFATAFYGVFDTRAGEIRYANAGHPHPLLIRPGEPTACKLSEPRLQGPAIGLFRGALYETGRHPLQAGDAVALYTDGVIEAVNIRNEEFGEKRLGRILLERIGDDAEAIGQAVLSGLHRHMDLMISLDDICIVMVKVEGNPAAGPGTVTAEQPADRNAAPPRRA